jgi:Tetratricopeptide repeat/Anaphase-promoting complex subunit 5
MKFLYGWRKPGWWAGAVATGLAVVFGVLGFWVGLWVDGALGAGVGVAAGVVAPLLGDMVRRRAEAHEAAKRVEPAARRLGPASLLDPVLAVVPFAGRQKELDALLAWCEDDAASPVQLVTGGGGTGKTRLSLELRRLLEDAGGWRSAEVDAGTEASALGAERAVAGGRRLLLVVDYADARAGLSGLLAGVAREPGRVRVLLLARQAGEWWQRLEGGGQASRDLVVNAARQMIELPDVIEAGTSAVDVVLDAVPWFAARLQVATGDIGPVSVTGVDGARILDLHAAALVAVLEALERRAAGAVKIDVSMVLDLLLGHERHYWQESARALKLFDVAGGLTAAQLSQAVAAACLLGAASENEAAGIPGRVPGAASSMTVALWLRGLYPPDASGLWLGSLRPDRLAELHATRELAGSPALSHNCLSGLTERQAQQALVLLARASAEHPEAKPLLESALFRFPDAPFGIRAPRETLIAVANSIPFPSVALAEAGASLASRIGATYPSGTTDRASWQGTSSALLAALGQREEALSAAEEATATYRGLTAASDAFRPSLAWTLNNLSGRLAGLRRWEEALAAIEEATAIYRDLAGSRPDAFRPNLASSLHNYSSRLASLGYPEEALAMIEEGVAIQRDLAASGPEASRSALAGALSGKSSRLTDLGRREEALAAIEEATAIYRDLAASRPDAFRPDLASSLHRQAACLADLGRREEGLAAIEEATAIYRGLATSRPDAFRPNLAMSLNSQSNRLADLGRREEALTAIEEAATIRRDLAVARPSVFRLDLAAALNNLSACLAELGRPGEALAAIEEATAIYQDLAVARPSVFRPDVAMSFNNQSLCLADLGRREEALAAIEEATAIYRDLAVARPTVFRPDVAMSLDNLSKRLADLGRPEEALAAIEEAVAIYRDLTAARPAAFGRRLADSLNVLAEQLSALGRDAGAQGASEEASRLSGDRPAQER